MLEAIKAGDVETACQALTEHIADGKEFVLHQLKRRSPE
jgi:DNA-binding GntR family transcriptional regulator